MDWCRGLCEIVSVDDLWIFVVSGAVHTDVSDLPFLERPQQVIADESFSVTSDSEERFGT